MRQLHLTPALFFAATLLPASLPAQTPAQTQPGPKSPAPLVRRPVQPSAEAPTQLPVTRVALYKNGVGFFEHSGRVTGSQSVTIDFTTAQLNDVLQSLTAIDLNGGRIAGADYNSTTPLDQQLRALALALPGDVTFSTLFNKLRGTRVEVTGSGAPFTGRLVDEEMHKTGPGKDEAGMTEGRFLTVAGDSGEVRIFQITPTLTVRLLDTAAHTDLTQYLQVLDANRNQSLRHLTLLDNAPANGTASRELHVSYISEVPIWKSTYRILFTTPKALAPTTAATPAPAQTATLQGWSVVDNTTGSDWNNVQLSLIAGAPQSFIQPLSQPIYSRRPEIPIAQQAQLTPQTHESGDSSVVSAGIGTGSGSNYGAGVSRSVTSSGGVQQGIYGGAGKSNLNENYLAGVPSNNSAAATLGGSIENETFTNLPLSGRAYQQLAVDSFNTNFTTSAFDDYFAYNLTDPITIRKNESALVPILQTKVDAELVTLASFAPNARQATPLRALWMTNTSDLTLDRGSFTIIENGSFAGQGLLDPIHPAEKRLLSYAVDQAVRVSTEDEKSNSRVTSITGAKGVLILHNTALTEVTYVVHNAAPETRTVLIEHPIHQGYTLETGTASSTATAPTPTPQPDETTPTLDRFRVVAGSGATVRLRVAERRPADTRYLLTNTTDNQLTFMLNETNHDPKLEAALQPILDARRRVADAQAALDKVNARLSDLRSDEERQRANVTALAAADKPSRERFVHDLNATEDQITATQKELTAAQIALQSARDDLASKIESLQIDETL